MDAVTYPHETVKDELDSHWLSAKVDVEDSKSVADSCGVSAIPVAVGFSADGAVLGRILGFVEPAVFGKELQELREAR